MSGRALRRHMKPWKAETARKMRNFPEPSEARLWMSLNSKQHHGRRWRRQHPMFGFIADFYCPQENLVIEVDGGYHADRKAQDARRDRIFREHRVHVLRFTNEQVQTALDTVLADIAWMYTEGDCPV